MSKVKSADELNARIRTSSANNEYKVIIVIITWYGTLKILFFLPN
jgi:hypothetical protein